MKIKAALVLIQLLALIFYLTNIAKAGDSSAKSTAFESGLETRAYPGYKNDIGWRADDSTNFDFFGWKNFILELRAHIRVISNEKPPGVNFRSINFNLWPRIKYHIDSCQSVNFGWYHWSEHYFLTKDNWLKDINELAVNYIRSTANDRINAMIGDTYSGNDYPLTWMARVSYQKKIFTYFEPGIFTSVYRYNRAVQALTDLQLRVNFGRGKYDVIAGYAFGKAPIILFQPLGFYWGFGLNW